jgi:hypothetical protein
MSRFKYSGRVAPGCKYHDAALLEVGEIVPPTIVTPPNPAWGKVAQYGATVYGKTPAYDPAGNCSGNFMSYKNQGPISNSDPNDMIVSYEFHTYMWVPSSGVSIL